jgi:hypothetical protein
MKPSFFRALPAIFAAVVLAGCGGGNDTPPTTLSGTAASGAPAANSNVAVACSKALASSTTVASASSTTAADGTWSVKLDQPTFPCVVTVSGGSLAAGVELRGYATSATNVDVTPLTTLIGAYATNAANGATLTQAMLDAAVTKLNDLLVAAGFGPLPANPLTAEFTATNGDAYDDYLESLMGALAQQNITVADLAAQIAADGAPAAPLKGPDVVGFDSMPSPLPESVPSLGFEATQTDSVGERLSLAAGSPHVLRAMTVGMVSWACESGAWNTADCVTTPGATYTHPVTLKVYDANGVQIATQTKTFTMPYRPSSDANCPDGRWKSTDGTCKTGDLFTITFDLASLNVTLPDNFSYDVSYNTRTSGASPLGVAGPYDSLNVGVYFSNAASPSIGTDRDVGTVLLNGALSDEGYGLLTRVTLGAN